MKLTKGAKFIFFSFSALFLLDLTTTLANGEIIHYLETNPIYLVTGSFLPIIALNIFAAVFLTYSYMKRSTDFKFFVMNLFTWLSLVRIIAIKNAISIYLNPPPIEAAMALTTAVKYTVYSNMMILYVFLPVILTQIAYYLFKIDHKIVKK